MDNRPATVKQLGNQLAGGMPAGSDHLKDTPTAEAGSKTGADEPNPAGSQPAPGKKSGKSKAEPVNPADYAHLKDKNGFAFDPDIHKTKLDGTPKLTKGNQLWLKSGKRINNSKSFIKRGAAQPGAQPGSETDAPGPGTEAAHYEASGRVMAETIFSLGQMFFGPEWAPQQVAGQIDERGQMSTAWAEYFRAKGLSDIPPGMAIAIAMGSYTLPRLAMPTTKSRFTRLGAWFKNRKKKKPAPPAAPVKEENTRQPSAAK